MLRSIVFGVTAVALFCATSASAQDRVRISINAGQQTSSQIVKQDQTFERYSSNIDIAAPACSKLGLSLLLRYSEGQKAFTPTRPTGAAPVDVTVGGLQAGGGIRLLF